MNVRSWSAVSILLASALGPVVGCGARESQQGAEAESATGSVVLAMSAIGPDGATYTLNGDYITLTPTSDGGSSGTMAFSTTTGTQSFSMSPGTYSGLLANGPTDGAPGWTLYRSGDGGATSVSAVLLDAQPYTFTVTAGATTNLTLHFEIANVGNITFSTGTVTTTLSVDAGQLAPGHAAVNGTAPFTGPSPSTTNAAVNSLLAIPTGATVSVPYAVTIALTSPFQMGVDQACANGTATVTATAVADGGAEDVYAAWFKEISAAPGALCFYDATSSQGSVASFAFTRFGSPLTSTFASVAGDASSTDEFQLSMTIATTPAYLNNGVLSLSELSQPVTLPASFISLMANVGGVFAQMTGGAGSTMTSLQVLP